MTRRLFIAGLALLLASCAALDPRTVVLSESELASLLARQFPQQRRVLEVIDVTMATPRLRLLPERNRIGTELDLSAAERITGRSVRGSLALDYALRFEPADTSVRLTQVRVDRVNLESGGLALPAPTQRIGGLIAEQLLEDLVIWRAKPEQAEMMRRLGVNSGAVNVTPRGVEIYPRPAVGSGRRPDPSGDVTAPPAPSKRGLRFDRRAGLSAGEHRANEPAQSAGS